MSRAQRTEERTSSQTETSPIPGKTAPEIGTHGLRSEDPSPHIAAVAIGHQPEQHHDPQDL